MPAGRTPLRLFQQRGTAPVLGVDISPEVIRPVREQSQPLGMTCQVGDTATRTPLGLFDLMTAVYMLKYATSRGQLQGRFRRVYDQSFAAGYVVVCTINPNFTFSKPNCTPYGLSVPSAMPDTERYITDSART